MASNQDEDHYTEAEHHLLERLENDPKLHAELSRLYVGLSEEESDKAVADFLVKKKEFIEKDESGKKGPLW